jgi:hypothetical protein
VHPKVGAQVLASVRQHLANARGMAPGSAVPDSESTNELDR